MVFFSIDERTQRPASGQEEETGSGEWSLHFLVYTHLQPISKDTAPHTQRVTRAKKQGTRSSFWEAVRPNKGTLLERTPGPPRD